MGLTTPPTSIDVKSVPVLGSGLLTGTENSSFFMTWTPEIGSRRPSPPKKIKVGGAAHPPTLIDVKYIPVLGAGLLAGPRTVVFHDLDAGDRLSAFKSTKKMKVGGADHSPTLIDLKYIPVIGASLLTGTEKYIILKYLDAGDRLPASNSTK